MAILKLNDWTTRRVMREQGLSNLPRLGRGHFGMAFDAGDNTVLKLTTDALQRDSQLFYLNGPAFPEFLEDKGYMGEQSNGAPLYLYRTERLETMRQAAPAVRKEARTFLTLMGDAYETACKTSHAMRHNRYYSPKAYEVLEAALDAEGLAPYRDSLEQLCRFAMDYEDVSADFHLGNLMARGNQLVFNDVICNSALLP